MSSFLLFLAAGSLAAGLNAGPVVQSPPPVAVLRAEISDNVNQAAQTQTTQSGQNVSSQTPAADVAALPRGKKLILKDGTVQLVREYQVQGDRVRYYSLDRSQWEEIPEALVDWDATKKLEAEENKREAQFVAKAHAQDEAENAPVLDVDASLELAPGIFLPDGAGLFVFDGKHVTRLTQAETQAKLSKGNALKQVLVPVPIVPSREVISIQRAHARFRMTAEQPEFYIRTMDAGEPNVHLIRAKVHGNSRIIENLDELFLQKRTVADTIDLLRWQVARGVYRYTLMKPLPPGEYSMVEQVGGGEPSLYVWDFGVDGDAAANAPAKTK